MASSSFGGGHFDTAGSVRSTLVPRLGSRSLIWKVRRENECLSGEAPRTPDFVPLFVPSVEKGKFEFKFKYEAQSNRNRKSKVKLKIELFESRSANRPNRWGA